MNRVAIRSPSDLETARREIKSKSRVSPSTPRRAYELQINSLILFYVAASRFFKSSDCLNLNALFVHAIQPGTEESK
jgi:hypothetical protein